MTITSYEADDLIINIPVTFDAGSEITDLTGGAVEAYAQRAGAERIAATAAAITSESSAKVTFADGTLAQGVYTLQVRVTVSGVTQTIADEVLTVGASV